MPARGKIAFQFQNCENVQKWQNSFAENSQKWASFLGKWKKWLKWQISQFLNVRNSLKWQNFKDENILNCKIALRFENCAFSNAKMAYLFLIVWNVKYFLNFRYDINTNPGTANSVSTAAFRFVASLLPGVIQYYDNKGKIQISRNFLKNILRNQFAY